MKFLVIVDMQNDFITGALGTPEAEIARDNLVEKLKQEDKDTVVIFTQDTHYDNYLQTLEGQKLPVEHCIRSTWGWLIDDDVWKMGTTGRVYDAIRKTSFGSRMSLPATLEGYDAYYADTIEICGLCTDICVISNALILRAAFPNTPITLDSKCCAGTTPQAHEAALTVMRSCQIEVN